MSIADPTVQSSIYAGTMQRTSAAFTDLVTNLPADPTTVVAGYQLDDDVPVQTTYGLGAIQRDGVGLYHWDVDTTGFAAIGDQVLMVILWDGVGGIDVLSDPTLVTVNGPPFVLTT